MSRLVLNLETLVNSIRVVPAICLYESSSDLETRYEYITVGEAAKADGKDRERGQDPRGLYENRVPISSGMEAEERGR